MKNSVIKNIAISFFLAFSIFFLWKSGILYSYSLYPVVKEERLHIFADWATPIKLGICHRLGFDVFNPSSCLNYPFNYGNIFLYIPYFKSLEKFYFFYFPIIIGFLFIYSVVSLIKPKKFIEYFLLISVIYAPSSLLVLERGNTDILIFLFIILMVYGRSSIFNFIILTLASLIKYYPVILGINFFIEKKRPAKKIIIISLLFVLTFFLFFYFTGESFQLVQHKMKIISPTWGNQFSIRGFALILKKLINYDYNIVLLASFVFFVFFSIIFSQFLKKNNFANKINIYLVEEKFFILSGNLIIAVYLISDNVYYREIFLILLLPLILKMKNIFNLKLFKYLFYFIIIRYIFFIISNYFIFFKKYFYLLYIKAASDLILISCFAAICILLNIKIFKKNFLNQYK